MFEMFLLNRNSALLHYLWSHTDS